MLELERTYLLKFVPDGLHNCEKKEVIDIYVPKNKNHPTLRIRKNGDKFEITKKVPIDFGDTSRLKEDTVQILEEEFKEFHGLHARIVSKIRYFYKHKDRIAEVDVFQGALKGLVLVDFEFDTEKEKEEFVMPDFCLVEVTQEEFIAGGMLSGKSYEDIEEGLKKLNYEKIIV